MPHHGDEHWNTLPTRIALDEESDAFFIWVPVPEVVRFQAFVDLSEGIGTVRTPQLEGRLAKLTARNKYSFLSILTTPSLRKHFLSFLQSIKDEIPWEPMTQDIFDENTWEELESFVKLKLI